MSWVEEVFIRKQELFLKTLELVEERADREAEETYTILKRHGIEPGAKILEVGCGTGRILLRLALKGYRVTGIDISPLFIEKAREKARKLGVNASLIVGDARRLEEVLEDRGFDAVLFYWTSILGYYDEETDASILRQCANITRDNGKLFILRQAVRDTTSLLVGLLGGRLCYISEKNDLLVIEEHSFDPTTSRTISKWTYYRRINGKLERIGKIEYNLRLYSPHEIIGLASRAGWSLEAIYDYRLEEYRIPRISPYLHYVFTKNQHS